jgi:hypothetical protein
MHRVQNGELERINNLGDLENFVYMTPCLPLQLHVNGIKSLLLQCFIVEFLLYINEDNAVFVHSREWLTMTC